MKKITVTTKPLHTIEFSNNKLIDLKFRHICENKGSEQMVAQTREFGDFQLRAIHLSDEFDWYFGRDDDGKFLAVPTKKEK